MIEEKLNLSKVAMDNTALAGRILNELRALEENLMGGEVAPQKIPQTTSLVQNSQHLVTLLSGIQGTVARIKMISAYAPAAKPQVAEAKPRRRCRARHAYKKPTAKRDSSGRFAPKPERAR